MCFMLYIREQQIENTCGVNKGIDYSVFCDKGTAGKPTKQNMTFCLGRSQTALDPFLTKAFLGDLFVKYSPFRRSKTSPSDYEIDEKLLLASENRQRCMEKMVRVPPVGIKLRGSTSENKLASVLIALCTDEKLQNVSLLYTRRSRFVSKHMRQISFPGGMKEDNEDFVQCALRETHEEIGLPPSRVEVWGPGRLITPPRTAAIMPVVGVVKNLKESELMLNTSEVEEAFVIPIKRLVSPESWCYTQFKSGYSSPVFVVDDKRIWGVTGFLTNSFLNCFLPQEFNYPQNRVKFIRSYKMEQT